MNNLFDESDFALFAQYAGRKNVTHLKGMKSLERCIINLDRLLQS